MGDALKNMLRFGTMRTPSRPSIFLTWFSGLPRMRGRSVGALLLMPLIGMAMSGCAELFPSNLMDNQLKADMTVPYPPTTFKNDGDEPEVVSPGLNRPIGPPDGAEAEAQQQRGAMRDPMDGMNGQRVELTPHPVSTDTDVSYGASGPSNVAGQQ